ncbi:MULTISPECIES: rhomboid family intramembrane serine protease [unclassified Fibrobacter]|uniref:rhomboid family protein n=1 Tax=unclassified Fibrobacter TaxID=2634177 RepID=UPI00091CD8FE|nr:MULTISPECIES: rhomboid family intramembrane serine protease [unclassified Fibrobacter]OWV08277.1 rhomboid family intramembrane serine protease [Fibrobacter sp. UWH3]SHL21372.1 Membrane associated serine protease, rhomboid family [Fibrobacter sp. UWH6]SHL74917.1 Membrane associated serine protease, rhomboid family [Fibrobacter sp. UWH5]
MRPFSFLPKVLRVLLLINAGVFAAAFVLGGVLGLQLNIPGVGPGNLRDYITYFGAYFPTVPYEAWRYVTYMFVHVDFWHFLFNMLMLWMFGSDVVDMMGSKHFTGMYMFCGIFAAVFSLVMCVLGLTNNPIIGASGALMGLFVAYYKFFPNRVILMFMFFPMRIKYAMWFMVGIDVFMAPSGDGVAHLAHLGGVVGGFIYMHFYERGFGKIGGLADKFERAARKARGPKFKMNDGGRAESSRSSRKSDEPLEGEVFYVDENKRMDEILKKVNESGINSLTDSERKFLLDASEKLRRRR